MAKNQRLHGRINERLLRLDHRIRAGRCGSAADIAKEFEVSARTIQRDLDLLRDRMGAPLEFDRAKQRWIYTDKSYALPAIQMTEGELVAILLAERLIRQYRGAPFEQRLRSAFDKIVQTLPEQVSVDLSALSDAYSFEIGPVSEIDARVFDALSKAASNHRRLELTYFTQSRGEENVRRIDPYHIHNYRGDWYVIAFDHLRHKVLDFRLDRIRSFRETGDRFTVAAGFDINAYLSEGFTMVRGEKKYTIELEFDAYQARWMRERQQWHPTEEREELPDGRLLLRMRLGGLDAVVRFVLQYGGHVVVRKPARLRRMIQQEILKLSELYGLSASTNSAKARQEDS
jgi:predicted DNA-binding transcriptional regulator YafY